MRTMISAAAATVIAAAASLSTADAAIITNGDFEAGDISGFDVTACGFSTTAVDDPVCGFTNVIDADPFISVNQDGDNDYLELETATGILLGLVTQTIEITSSAFILSFDAALLAAGPGLGSSTSPDTLSVGIRDENGAFQTIFRYRETGAEAGPFGPGAFASTLTTPSDAFFDVGVVADLSDYIGQLVTLQIGLFAEPDGRIVSYGLDNFTLAGTPPSEIPIPAPLALFATGLIALRRWSGKRGG